MSLTLIRDLQELALQAKTPEDLNRLLARVTAVLEFEEFAHGGYEAGQPAALAHQYVVTSYPVQWRELYVGRGYVEIDPVVSYCASNLLPATWDRITRRERAQQKKSREMMEEAARFGLKHGIAVPIHAGHANLALLSLSRDRPLEHDVHQRMLLAQAVLPYIYEASRRLFLSSEARLPAITQRERECLRWVADGKTTWEISRILCISENTVLYHIKNAQEKLGACNRTHAVAKALRFELIR
jgi:DNA-binding CsgD family transcriptional regulator